MMQTGRHLDDAKAAARIHIDAANAQAKYADGVLELTLPKKSATPVKELTIQ